MSREKSKKLEDAQKAKYLNEIGHRLSELRALCYPPGRGSLRRMADATGIDDGTLNTYEHGTEPSAINLSTIVETTGCSAPWLLSGKGPMFPAETEKTLVSERDARYTTDMKARVLSHLKLMIEDVEENWPEDK